MLVKYCYLHFSGREEGTGVNRISLFFIAGYMRAMCFIFSLSLLKKQQQKKAGLGITLFLLLFFMLSSIHVKMGETFFFCFFVF